MKPASPVKPQGAKKWAELPVPHAKVLLASREEKLPQDQRAAQREMLEQEDRYDSEEAENEMPVYQPAAITKANGKARKAAKERIKSAGTMGKTEVIMNGAAVKPTTGPPKPSKPKPPPAGKRDKTSTPAPKAAEIEVETTKINRRHLARTETLELAVVDADQPPRRTSVRSAGRISIPNPDDQSYWDGRSLDQLMEHAARLGIADVILESKPRLVKGVKRKQYDEDWKNEVCSIVQSSQSAFAVEMQAAEALRAAQEDSESGDGEHDDDSDDDQAHGGDKTDSE
ncbi:hypothetical protein P7C70_g8808, partial [Phenoliferia sp. Uapishka_3]